jgi:hypothetical protein
MSYDSFKPIETPASGTLQVLGIARISTKNQDEMSLEDQADMHKEFVHDNYDHPFNYEPVATQAKGEWLDRDELEQIRAAINSGNYDLIIMEDLGRLLRGLEAVNFCKIAVDQNVRLIAINDGVDTYSDDWEEKAATASIRHTRYVEETSRRIKQRKRARFVREGRALPCEIFGYFKTPGAKTELDLVRDTGAEAIYDRIFAMLEDGASYAEVADWLNDKHVPVGPYSRLTRWTGQMVARLVHNPILKGVRERNRHVTRKHHGSGKRKSVKAKPEELRTRICPHLAFIDPERYDRVLYLLEARNKNKGRKPVNGPDPLLNRPRKRTVWPGQHLACSVCNRLFVYGGHGQAGFLTCKGIDTYNCWNTFSVCGAEAGRRIFAAVLTAIQALPQFDDGFRQIVAMKLQTADKDHGERLRELDREKAKIELQQQNLLAQLREYGPSSFIRDDAQRLEDAKAHVVFQISKEKLAKPVDASLPSIEDLKSMAMEAIGVLAPGSAEFLRQMQQLVPQIWLYPFRLLDGGGGEKEAGGTAHGRARHRHQSRQPGRGSQDSRHHRHVEHGASGCRTH